MADYDFITTCNWTSTGTFTLRAYRGSTTDVVTSYSLFYRKVGDETWTETTNGQVGISKELFINCRLRFSEGTWI